MRDEPFINPGRATDPQNVEVLSKTANSERQSGTECIIDVRVTDTDNSSNRFSDPLKVLLNQENEKKIS